jgi:hypothetical protein
MLRLRQMIPPVTARTLDGRGVRAWDYKQKKNLVVAFLHAECNDCAAWLRELAACAAELREHDAAALVIFPNAPPRAMEITAAQIVLAVDMGGRSQRAFLGEDCYDAAGLRGAGVLVTDRFGELFALWTSDASHKLPAAEEVMGWLAHIQVACEECGAPHWPVD